MFLIFSLWIGLQSQAQTLPLDRQKFLQEFSQNPAQASKKLPFKYNSKGQRISQVRGPFHGSVVDSRRFVTLKDEERMQTCRASKPGQPCQSHVQTWAAPKQASEVELFLEGTQVERNLEKLQLMKLQAGATDVEPWSGDYWATANGGIAARYNDPSFPRWQAFSEIWNYMNNPQMNDLTQAGVMEKLSPSEKYDLLMSDSEKTLTRAVLSESHQVWDRDGKIENWWGICHGWSPAAMVMSRPRHAVSVPLAQFSNPLKFYPDDLKALASHLWANGRYPQVFIGGRCNDKNPSADENGRIQSEDCFDINPASWHLALLHSVGMQKKSFVMDATYDYEVWNQPVASYEYTFFNPDTKAQSNDFNQVMIQLKNFSKDPFAKYRSSQAVYLVGVAMTVRYIRERTPSASEENSEKDDSIMAVQYFYDLEMDASGNVIGGEWYHQAHPDFLWKPRSGAQPLSLEDANLEGNWERQNPPPASWTAKAQSASQRSQLLYRVIDELIRRAQ